MASQIEKLVQEHDKVVANLEARIAEQKTIINRQKAQVSWLLEQIGSIHTPEQRDGIRTEFWARVESGAFG